MTGDPNRFRQRASLLAGMLISILFLWLATRNIEWRRLWEQLQQVRVLPLAIGAAAAFAAIVAMAYRWHTLLGTTASVTVADTFDFTTVGFLAGLVMPQRLGDIVKVVLLARRAGVSRTTVLGSVVLERLSDVIMLLVLAAIFAVTVRLPILLEAGLGALAAGTGFGIVMLRFGSAPAALATGRRYLPAGLMNVVEPLVAKLSAGLTAIDSASHFGKALSLAALVWILSGISMSAYVTAFDLAVPWYAGFLVILLTNLGGILPSSPGSIGVYHYMTVVALTVFTDDRTAALSFAIITHALAMLLMVSTGLWGLGRQGLTLRAVRGGV